MRKRTLGKSLFLLLLIFGASAAVLFLRARGCVGAVCPTDDVRITSLEAQAELKADGSIMVNERITYFFETPQRGVHRDIPATFRTVDGVRRVPVVVRTARTVENVVMPHQDEVSASSLRVWFGDPKQEYVGEQTFSLTYIMNGGVWSGATNDYFQWDVVGPDQRMDVERITAKISAPTADVNPDDVTVTCNDGPASCKVSRADDGVSFESENGMLIATVSVPKLKLVALPGTPVSPIALYVPYAPFFVAGLLFVILAWRWLRQDAGGPQLLTRWRLALVLPLVAIPFALQRVMMLLPTFSVPGSGPNAAAALAICLEEICLFGLLAFITGPRRTSEPPPPTQAATNVIP